MRQFVESLKRLYTQQKINDVVVLMLCKNNKITEEEKQYILDSVE